MEGLDQFQFLLRPEPAGIMTLSESLHDKQEQLLTRIAGTSGAPTAAVAASIFMRRFGLYVAGQLFLLGNGKVWDGPASELYLEETPHGIAFAAAPAFMRTRKDHDLQLVIKGMALPAVTAFSQASHVSRLILWENIWGYVIWMYSQLDSKQAASDSSDLLNDAFWQPELKRSPFRQFLGGRSLRESQSDYRRITCCLLKEVPDTGKCPYCPLAAKQ